jgi:23S rRNA (uracil1939-C5)-methyltransferase
MLEKNKEYIIIIDGMGYEGEGVGKINGFTVFVEGAITGEKVKVKIVKVNKKFAFGKLIDIIERSEYREKPICPIYKRCGGCQIQHISYNGQLNFKTKRVKDCLERIGKIKLNDIKFHDTIGMKNPYRYRNKVQLPVRKNNGSIDVGFYAKRTHEIIDMSCCYIQDETADKVVKIIKKWIKNYNISIYDELTGKGFLRHIMVRKAYSTGEIMVVIVTSSLNIKHKEELVKLLCNNLNGVKSIIQNINTRRDNVILGEKCITLWGEDTISDYIGDLKFQISPLSFFQVNPVQTEVLYNKALEYADLQENEIVFDAYCGTGTISLFLSKKAKKVYGVEIVEQAIENAKENAKKNGIENVEFIVGKSEIIVPKLIGQGIVADVVVVDPPRKGCDKELLVSISKMKPKKIVYVSCDPATLARDLNILEEFGYKTVEVQPVDMFPQTAHVECVVLMSRVGK